MQTYGKDVRKEEQKNMANVAREAVVEMIKLTVSAMEWEGKR